MCFKNLPIEFDDQGNATLVLYPEAGQAGGTGVPDAVERKPIEDNPAAIKELLVRTGWLTPEQASLADDAQVSA